MPHLIPLSNPPSLSLEWGIVGHEALGYDYFLYEGHHEQDRVLGDLQLAISRLAISQVPHHVSMRERINQRFRDDTRGAPAVFPFAAEQPGGILELLSKVDRPVLAKFFEWNAQRMNALRDAMAVHMPDLPESIYQRTQQLISDELLPDTIGQSFPGVAKRIVELGRYAALDSFEGGIADGSTSGTRIFISHLFDDGYHIGRPTVVFWQTGFHEVGHRVAHGFELDHAYPFEVMKLVEEVWLSHCEVVSEPNTKLPKDSVLRASSEGHYPTLRRLFGYAFEVDGNVIDPSMIGEAWLASEIELLKAEFVRKLRHNFTALFPDRGKHALDAFMLQYSGIPPNSTNIFQQQACVKTWAEQAAANVGK